MFTTQLIIDVDETGDGYEFCLRFGPDDLEWAGTLQRIEDCEILGPVIVQALVREQKLSAVES
jgi:hypothetical protein